MFIYNKDTHLNLLDYGIEIPLLGQRGRLVLNYIKNNFVTNKLILDPLSDPTLEQLQYAHSNEFINRLSSDPTHDLMETFELVDPKGDYHRYNPDKATRNIPDLYKRISRQVTGTILTCETALTNNFSFHLGGGLHHAMKNNGRGFCLLNDIVIAARHMQKQHELKNIWVIDVDVHKGDGTASLTAKDDSIKTLSIHMQDGWPLDMGDGSEDWFIPSDIDIPVIKSDDYNQKLSTGLERLKSFPKADLCIIVQGSDPYELDELESSANIKLSIEDMLKRDLLVYHFLKELNIPQAYVMAGGYGKHAHKPYIQFLESIKENIS